MFDKIMNFVKKLEDFRFRRIFRISTILSLITLLMLSLATDVNVKEDKQYKDWDHVALYILMFNDLPSNYVPKSQGVSADEYDVTVYAVYDNTRTPIKLPEGYEYTEVYINATKEDVGLERFVFSDVQLFYTADHYNIFEEVHRFDILGSHYMFSMIFWVVLVTTSTVVIISFKCGILTLEIIKTDLISDLVLIKNYVKEKSDSFRKKIDS